MDRSVESRAASGKPRSAEGFGQEPTVFGAMRRHRMMVVVVVLITIAVSVGYTLVVPELYRASARATVPLPVSMSGDQADQYLDSQVLLLRSAEVAERAARIANDGLGEPVLQAGDFIGEQSSLAITPPEGANPGSFGANTIAVAFTWPGARVAQVGANAALQAFGEERAAAIRAEADARVAGIDRAIGDPRTQNQVGDLENQRAQVLVGAQVDLASQPTIAWAVTPEEPVNGNSRNAAIIGVVLGIVLGGALAYVWSVRRQRFDDGQGPGGLYEAPQLGEIPAFEMKKSRPSGSAPVGVLPVVRGQDGAVQEAFRFTAGAFERIRATRGDGRVFAFFSPHARSRSSEVVADLALTLAEGGTRVLVVDARADGALTALLLPGIGWVDGWAQLVTGQGSVADCVRRSPWNPAVAVLGAGRATDRPITGVAYATSAKRLLSEVAKDVDVVLIDSPPLLEVAEAGELVASCDGAVAVVGAEDLIREHVNAANRLDLIDSDVVGYIFQQPPKRSMRSAMRRLWAVVARRDSTESSIEGGSRAPMPAESRKLTGAPGPVSMPQPRR
jgi:Mrp family chromosome partitioning ATPase